MKAIRKNLIEKWIIKSELKDLMEFWDEIWYFKRIEWQRVQNMWHELSNDEFMNAYNEYLNDDKLIITDNYKEIIDWYYLLRRWENSFWNHWCFIYKSETNEFFQRIIKPIKKYDDQLCVKINNEFIILDN